MASSWRVVQLLPLACLATVVLLAPSASAISILPDIWVDEAEFGVTSDVQGLFELLVFSFCLNLCLYSLSLAWRLRTYHRVRKIFASTPGFLAHILLVTFIVTLASTSAVFSLVMAPGGGSHRYLAFDLEGWLAALAIISFAVVACTYLLLNVTLKNSMIIGGFMCAASALGWALTIHLKIDMALVSLVLSLGLAPVLLRMLAFRFVGVRGDLAPKYKVISDAGQSQTP